MMVLKKIFAFFYKDLLNEASYRFAFLTQFLGMLFAALSFFFLSKMLDRTVLPSLEPYGGDYFSFVLIGVAFATYLRVSLESFSNSIRNSQLIGTLEAVLLTQTKIPTIILSSSIYSFFMTSVRVIVFLSIGAVFLGMKIGNGNFLGAVILLILTIFCFSCFGIISASFIMVLKKGDPLNWLFINVSWLLGGVYYPVGILPDWVQKISLLLPLTYSLEGMRLALLKGYSTFQLLPYMLPLAIISIVLLPVSMLSFKFAINKARENGSLTHY
jgi:ABC-2 type transport system permease protein